MKCGAGYLHVKVERRRIGVNVDDGHLPAVLTEIDLIGENLRLIRLDEGDELIDRVPQLVQRPFVDLRGVDVVDCRLAVVQPRPRASRAISIACCIRGFR